MYKRQTEPASNAFLRLYETVATGLHDRAAYSVSKAQALLEASAAGKVTAVAASAAAVAGGGYASVERSVSGLAAESARPKMQREAPDRVRTANPQQATVTGPASPAHLPAPAPQAQSKDEFANSKTPITRAAPEFAGARKGLVRRDRASDGRTTSDEAMGGSGAPVASPEFDAAGARPTGGEFGP